MTWTVGNGSGFGFGFGRYGVPVRYSPAEQQWDLGLLLEAANPDELHRALVLHPPAAVGREPTLPVTLLRQVHEVGSEEVAPTLVLLATDPRFSAVTGLAAALVETGLVPSEVVDLVAEAFAVADERVWWSCPEGWFDDEQAIDLVMAGHAEGRADTTAEHEAGPPVVGRTVTTDARRWAVTHIVARDPERWPSLYPMASDAGPGVARGVWLGLLDAADAIGGKAISIIERAALRSGDATVRLASLRRLAADDPDGAAALARRDPNARVRSRAGSLAPPLAGKIEGDRTTHITETTDAGGGTQTSLF